MLKGIFEYITKTGCSLDFRDKKIDFSNPTDFLWFTDIDLLSEGLRTKDNTLHRLIHDLLYRRPLKRALVINRKTVEGDLQKFLSTDVTAKKMEDSLREIAAKIHKNSGVNCLLEQIWIDMPKAPKFKEVSTTYVRTSRTANHLKPLSEFFPVKEWTDQYELNKLKGHIFAPEECLERVAKSAKEIFEAEHDIKILETAFCF